MIRLENKNTFIIGVDCGYQLCKTESKVFDNGVKCLGNVEPSVREHSVFFDGKYYKVAEERAVITENKTGNINALVQTLAAIAMELRPQKITNAEVILAVGLPFSNYGKGKAELEAYYGKDKLYKFSYEGTEYQVKISRTIVFPQCYAAIAPRLGNMAGDYLVVDLGSKTTDVVFIKNGYPNESRSITIEKAMVKWIKLLQGDFQIHFNRELPEEEVIKIILEKKSYLDNNEISFIKDFFKEQVKNLEYELTERGYDLDHVEVIFMGGGARVVKDYTTRDKHNMAFDSDLSSNCKGYEYLAEKIMKRGQK